MGNTSNEILSILVEYSLYIGNICNEMLLLQESWVCIKIFGKKRQDCNNISFTFEILIYVFPILNEYWQNVSSTILN